MLLRKCAPSKFELMSILDQGVGLLDVEETFPGKIGGTPTRSSSDNAFKSAQSLKGSLVCSEQYQQDTSQSPEVCYAARDIYVSYLHLEMPFDMCPTSHLSHLYLLVLLFLISSCLSSGPPLSLQMNLSVFPI